MFKKDGHFIKYFNVGAFLQKSFFHLCFEKLHFVFNLFFQILKLKNKIKIKVRNKVRN